MASSQFFPSSIETDRVSSSRWSNSSFRKLNITSVRLWIGLPDHPGKASFDAATALFTSSTVQQGASAITSPVLEFVTGMYFFVFDSFHSLLMQYFNLLTAIIPPPLICCLVC